MFNLTKHTSRATPSVTKLVCLALSIGVVVLSAVSRPTDLQEELIDTVWRENGLYILGMVGIVFSSISFLSFTLFGFRNRIIELKYLDILLHFIGCVVFLIFGAAVIYSVLMISLRIQYCCETYFEEKTQCELPGFVNGFMDSCDYAKKNLLPIQYSRFAPYYPLGVSLPCISGCMKPIDSWRCTQCINQAVQPHYGYKGAVGALGILTSIFYGVVVVVSIKAMRQAQKNPGLRASF